MLDHFDDPVWPFVIRERLKPYLNAIRSWWCNVETLDVQDTGVYKLGELPGLYYRFTRTPIRSPLRNIQAFPFILAQTLNISGVVGGSTKLLQHICAKDRNFTFAEYTVIEIHNLPSTFNQGQLLAFVPTSVLESAAQKLGKWIYITQKELEFLTHGKVLASLLEKAMLKA